MQCASCRARRLTETLQTSLNLGWLFEHVLIWQPSSTLQLGAAERQEAIEMLCALLTMISPMRMSVWQLDCPAWRFHSVCSSRLQHCFMHCFSQTHYHSLFDGNRWTLLTMVTCFSQLRTLHISRQDPGMEVDELLECLASDAAAQAPLVSIKLCYAHYNGLGALRTIPRLREACSDRLVKLEVRFQTL